MNNYDLFKFRHLILGDDHLGLYDSATKTLNLKEDFENHREPAKAWFMRRHGIPIKVLVGKEEIAKAAPLRDFPPEIKALSDPFLGHRTPALIDYARKHFGREEFNRRYQGAFEFGPDEEPSATEQPEPADTAEEPKRRGRPKKSEA